MSIEQALQDNTAALNALREQLTKGGAAPAAAVATTKADKPATTKAEKPAAKPKSEHTREEMVAVLGEVSEKLGKDAARGLFQKEGVVKMIEIADGDIDAVYKAAKAKLEADDDM